jgi:F-type H+-transporting ATPase subunit delta
MVPDYPKLEKEGFNVDAERIGATYAQALYNAAQKSGQLDQVLSETESLVRDVLAGDTRLERMFASLALGRQERAAVITKAFKDRSSSTFFNFLLVLNNHDRLDLIRPIVQALRDLHDKCTNRLPVGVLTAIPLPEDQRQMILAGVRERFQKEPVLIEKVDPEILGGIKIRIGDQMFDGSVLTRIQNLRQQILARSSHEIQSRRDRFCS